MSSVLHRSRSGQLLSFSVLFVVFVVSVLGQSTAWSQSDSDSPLCRAGSPSNMELHNQVTGKSSVGQSDFLNTWRRFRQTFPMPPKVSENDVDAHPNEEYHSSRLIELVAFGGDAARQAARQSSGAQRFIRRSCIAKALTRTPQIQGHTSCSSDLANPRSMRNAPCITDAYIDYVHFTVNEAINCLSDPRDPLDAQLLFAMINAETAFGTFLSNAGGQGLMQLSTSAAKEMSPGYGGFEDLEKRMSRNPQACKSFASLVQQPLQTEGGRGRERIKTCQFVSLGSGAARNALTGIGYFAYHRDGSFDSIEDALVKMDLGKHSQFRKIRDLLTLITFGPHGPAGAKFILKKYGAQFKRMKYNEIKKLLLESPLAETEYLRKINQMMNHTFEPQSDPEPAAASAPQGARRKSKRKEIQKRQPANVNTVDCTEKR